MVVNISAGQLGNPELVSIVRYALDKYQVAAKFLC